MDSPVQPSPSAPAGFRWRLVLVIAGSALVIAFIVFAAQRILHDRRATWRVTEYQAAYLQRMRDIEDQLTRYHAEFGEFPDSMDQWIGRNPAAAGLLDPIPHAFAPFDLHVELLSYPERVLIATEPGVQPAEGEPVRYVGSGVFNSLPDLQGTYTQEDVARTLAAIEFLKRDD